MKSDDIVTKVTCLIRNDSYHNVQCGNKISNDLVTVVYHWGYNIWNDIVTEMYQCGHKIRYDVVTVMYSVVMIVADYRKIIAEGSRSAIIGSKFYRLSLKFLNYFV